MCAEEDGGWEWRFVGGYHKIKQFFIIYLNKKILTGTVIMSHFQNHRTKHKLSSSEIIKIKIKLIKYNNIKKTRLKLTNYLIKCISNWWHHHFKLVCWHRTTLPVDEWTIRDWPLWNFYRAVKWSSIGFFIYNSSTLQSITIPDKSCRWDKQSQSTENIFDQFQNEKYESLYGILHSKKTLKSVQYKPNQNNGRSYSFIYIANSSKHNLGVHISNPEV